MTIGILAVLALALALVLGAEVALLTGIGMVLALVYSVHPLRAKRNGWIGNALVGYPTKGCRGWPATWPLARSPCRV